MTLTKKQRKEVWDKSDGVCWYCGCNLPEKGWHADHFEPIGRENRYEWDREKKRYNTTLIRILRPQLDTIENTVPSCRPCNLYKSSYDIEWWRKLISRAPEIQRKANSGFRAGERFGLIEVHEQPVVFWFENRG